MIDQQNDAGQGKLPIIILDATSLFRRRNQGVLTGIDRVEFAIASWLCSGQGAPDAEFLIRTPWWRGLVSRPQMARALTKMRQTRLVDAGPGALLDRLVDILNATTPRQRPEGAWRLAAPQPSKSASWGRIADATRSIRGALRLNRALRANPRRIRFLHCSHLGLHNPRAFGWVRDFGVPMSVFIHDMIPVDFPQYCSDGARLSHMARMQVVSDLATRVQVNSQYTADRLGAYFADQRLPMPSIGIHRLGSGDIGGTLLPPRPADDDLGIRVPFFLVVGTIEGRKNVAGILAAWRALASAADGNVPKLVLAGNRGWSAQATFRDIDTMTDIGNDVIEVSGLNDREVALLVDNAEAVICASFAEGYSLVPAEALARGCNVLLSDIPAHQEIAMQDPLRARLFDPQDPGALVREIIALPARRSGGALSHATTWDDFAAGLCLEAVST